jgi:cation diffusion facilitator CzcD-associated flavoprotein CzcO
MTAETDVAVIGAGPYGLSISAHLSAGGIEHRIFGPPMQTWRAMPKGMFLKSVDFATNVYTPRRGFSFIDYCRERGLSHAEPISMELFSTYGLWAQEQLVPHLENVLVNRLSKNDGAFEIGLADGSSLTARRVVMATGLAFFAFLPGVLRGLPSELVTHTSQNREFEKFRGKDVVVLGAGQSALEAAVLLHEAGARPQLLSRGYGAAFADPPRDPRPLRHRVLHPMSVLGPSRTGYFLQHVPHGFHFLLPDAKRVQLTRKLWGPWGSWWLAPRYVGKVPGIPYHEIAAATPRGGRLALRLRDVKTRSERELVVDHLIAGTGYEPDLDTIALLDRGLSSQIARIERAPRLSMNFESSVPGLYFVGAASAFSFGPIVRFVAGAQFTAPAVVKHLARAAKDTGSAVAAFAAAR